MLAINGGQPVRGDKWPAFEDGTRIFSMEEREFVNQVLETGRLFRYDTRIGSETMTGAFEKSLAEYFGCKYALAVSSGTTALALALMTLNFCKGFGVACPTFGFPATASAVLLAGGVPRLFASDSNLDYDIDDMRDRWDDNIKVIIVVHMRGYAQPIDKIIAFANEKGALIIEDAVPAMGVRANGRLLGTFGDIGCFSTQSSKTIVTGEGGFIITNEARYIERAILLSGAYESRISKHEIKIHKEMEQLTPLYNFRMDEVRAAIALPQVKKIDSKVARMQKNYNYISQRIIDIPDIRTRKHNYPDGYLGNSLFFFVDRKSGSWIAKALTAEGIIAKNVSDSDNVRSFEKWKFIDEINQPSFHQIDAIKKTKSYMETAIYVKLPDLLTEKDLDDVVIAIKKVMEYPLVN